PSGRERYFTNKRASIHLGDPKIWKVCSRLFASPAFRRGNPRADPAVRARGTEKSRGLTEAPDRGSWHTSNSAPRGGSTLGGGGSRPRVFRVLVGASPSAAGDWSRDAAVHRRPAATPARVRCPAGPSGESRR